jgi:hypothetical protein
MFWHAGFHCISVAYCTLGIRWMVTNAPADCTYLHVGQIIVRRPILVHHGWSKSDLAAYIPQQPLRNVAAPNVAHSAMHL